MPTEAPAWEETEEVSAPNWADTQALESPVPSPLEFQGPPLPPPSPPPATMRTAGLRERLGLGPLGDILGVGRGVQRELQREAGGGVPTPKELVDVGFQFTTVPPQLAKPIEKITDVPINLLPPTAAGAVQGVRDIALQVPWAAGVVGMGKRAGDLLYGAFLADFLLQVPQAYEQYKALRAQGRNQEAARLAVSQVGTGLLMGAGLKRHQEIRAGGRVDPERAKLANDILELDAAVPGTLDAAKGLIQRQAPETQRQAPAVPIAPVAPPQREETPVAPVAPAEPTAAAQAVTAAGQVPEAAAAVIPEARALPAQAAAEASARAAEISKPAWVINLEAVEKAGNLNEAQAKRLAKWRAEQPAAPAAEPVAISEGVQRDKILGQLSAMFGGKLERRHVEAMLSDPDSRHAVKVIFQELFEPQFWSNLAQDKGGSATEAWRQSLETGVEVLDQAKRALGIETKPAAPAAQPKEANAVAPRIEQESRQPEHPGVAQGTAVSPDQPEVRQEQGGQAGGGNRPVGEPKKEESVLLTRDWDLFSENLADDLESFADTRGTGKRDYDMQDVADRFVDYAKQDKSGKPLDELVGDFAKTDEASAGQIRKLRQSVKSVMASEATKEPVAEPAPVPTAGKGKDDGSISSAIRALDSSKDPHVKEWWQREISEREKTALELGKSKDDPVAMPSTLSDSERSYAVTSEKLIDAQKKLGQLYRSDLTVELAQQHGLTYGTQEEKIARAEKILQAPDLESLLASESGTAGVPKGMPTKVGSQRLTEPPSPKPKEPWELNQVEWQDHRFVLRRLAESSASPEALAFAKDQLKKFDREWSEQIGNAIRDGKKIPENVLSEYERARERSPTPERMPTTKPTPKPKEAPPAQPIVEFKSGQKVEYYSPVTKTSFKGTVTGEKTISGQRWVSIVNEDGAPVVQKAEDVKPPSQPTIPAEGVGKGVPFTRDEIRVGKPSTSRRTRANGVDGEVRVEVDSPLKVTDPEIWSQISDTSKLHAVVEGRLEFSTGKAPKKTEPKWAVWGGSKSKPELIAKDLTYQQAIERAKDHVESSTQPPPAATEGGGKPGPGLGAGPGAAGAGWADVAMQRLKEGIEALPKSDAKQKLAWADKWAEREARGRDLADRMTLKMAAVNASVRDSMRGVRSPTELGRKVGELDYLLQRSSAISHNTAEAMRKQMPSEDVRAGLWLYADAHGDLNAIRDTIATMPADTPANVKRALNAALNLTPKEKAWLPLVRDYFDNRAAEAQAAGVLNNALDDYFTHIWRVKDNMPVGIQSALNRGAISEYFQFARERKLPIILEGIKNPGMIPGKRLEPVLDAAKVMPYYNYAMDRAIASREFIRSLSDLTASDGRPLVSPTGVRSQIPDPSGTGGALLIKPKVRPEEVSDYRALDHPSMRKWNWAGKDDQGRTVFYQGDLVVHPEAYERLARMLDRSRLTPSAVTKAALKYSGELKAAKLGMLSTFHLLHVGKHAIFHWTNPFAAAVRNPIDWESPQVRFAVEQGHLKLAPEPGEINALSEGLGAAGNMLIHKVPVLGPISRAFSEWMFREYIPRLKLHTFENALQRNMAMYGPGRSTLGKVTAFGAKALTPEEIAARTGDAVNAAYGELNKYWLGKFGRDPRLQRALRLGFLAPDFGEARLRFVGKAFTKYGNEERMALFLNAALVYTAARIGNYLSTGDPQVDDPRHAFEVKVGDHWVGMRSVIADLAHAMSNFSQFMRVRLNPGLAEPLIEMLSRTNARGQPVDAMGQVKDMLRRTVPITFQGLTESDRHVWESFSSSMGLMQRRGDAVSSVHELARKWKKDRGIESPVVIHESPVGNPYREARVALEMDDEPRFWRQVQEQYRRLRLNKTEHPAKVIEQAFTRYYGMPFTGKQALEKSFLAEMEPRNRVVYQQAVQQRKDELKKFKTWWKNHEAAFAGQ